MEKTFEDIAELLNLNGSSEGSGNISQKTNPLDEDSETMDVKKGDLVQVLMQPGHDHALDKFMLTHLKKNPKTRSRKKKVEKIMPVLYIPGTDHSSILTVNQNLFQSLIGNGKLKQKTRPRKSTNTNSTSVLQESSIPKPSQNSQLPPAEHVAYIQEVETIDTRGDKLLNQEKEMVECAICNVQFESRSRLAIHSRIHRRCINNGIRRCRKGSESRTRIMEKHFENIAHKSENRDTLVEKNNENYSTVSNEMKNTSRLMLDFSQKFCPSTPSDISARSSANSTTNTILSRIAKTATCSKTTSSFVTSSSSSCSTSISRVSSISKTTKSITVPTDFIVSSQTSHLTETSNSSQCRMQPGSSNISYFKSASNVGSVQEFLSATEQNINNLCGITCHKDVVKCPESIDNRRQKCENNFDLLSKSTELLNKDENVNRLSKTNIEQNMSSNSEERETTPVVLSSGDIYNATSNQSSQKDGIIKMPSIQKHDSSKKHSESAFNNEETHWNVNGDNIISNHRLKENTKSKNVKNSEIVSERKSNLITVTAEIHFPPPEREQINTTQAQNRQNLHNESQENESSTLLNDRSVVCEKFEEVNPESNSKLSLQELEGYALIVLKKLSAQKSPAKRKSGGMSLKKSSSRKKCNFREERSQRGDNFAKPTTPCKRKIDIEQKCVQTEAMDGKTHDAFKCPKSDTVKNQDLYVEQPSPCTQMVNFVRKIENVCKTRNFQLPCEPVSQLKDSESFEKEKLCGEIRSQAYMDDLSFVNKTSYCRIPVKSCEKDMINEDVCSRTSTYHDNIRNFRCWKKEFLETEKNKSTNESCESGKEIDFNNHVSYSLNHVSDSDFHHVHICDSSNVEPSGSGKTVDSMEEISLKNKSLIESYESSEEKHCSDKNVSNSDNHVYNSNNHNHNSEDHVCKDEKSGNQKTHYSLEKISNNKAEIREMECYENFTSTDEKELGEDTDFEIYHTETDIFTDASVEHSPKKVFVNHKAVFMEHRHHVNEFDNSLLSNHEICKISDENDTNLSISKKTIVRKDYTNQSSSELLQSISNLEDMKLLERGECKTKGDNSFEVSKRGDNPSIVKNLFYNFSRSTDCNVYGHIMGKRDKNDTHDYNENTTTDDELNESVNIKETSECQKENLKVALLRKCSRLCSFHENLERLRYQNLIVDSEEDNEPKADIITESINSLKGVESRYSNPKESHDVQTSDKHDKKYNQKLKDKTTRKLKCKHPKSKKDKCRRKDNAKNLKQNLSSKVDMKRKNKSNRSECSPEKIRNLSNVSKYESEKNFFDLTMVTSKKTDEIKQVSKTEQTRSVNNHLPNRCKGSKDVKGEKGERFKHKNKNSVINDTVRRSPRKCQSNLKYEKPVNDVKQSPRKNQILGKHPNSLMCPVIASPRKSASKSGKNISLTKCRSPISKSVASPNPHKCDKVTHKTVKDCTTGRGDFRENFARKSPRKQLCKNKCTLGCCATDKMCAGSNYTITDTFSCQNVTQSLKKNRDKNIVNMAKREKTSRTKGKTDNGLTSGRKNSNKVQLLHQRKENGTRNECKSKEKISGRKQKVTLDKEKLKVKLFGKMFVKKRKDAIINPCKPMISGSSRLTNKTEQVKLGRLKVTQTDNECRKPAKSNKKCQFQKLPRKAPKNNSIKFKTPEKVLDMDEMVNSEKLTTPKKRWTALFQSEAGDLNNSLSCSSSSNIQKPNEKSVAPLLRECEESGFDSDVNIMDTLCRSPYVKISSDNHVKLSDRNSETSEKDTRIENSDSYNEVDFDSDESFSDEGLTCARFLQLSKIQNSCRTLPFHHQH